MKKGDLVLDRYGNLYKVDSIGGKCVMTYEYWHGKWGSWRERKYKQDLYLYNDKIYKELQSTEKQRLFLMAQLKSVEV